MKSPLLILALWAISAAGQVPDQIVDASRPAAWVAADIAIGADGAIRADKLKSYAPLIQRDAAVEAKEARKAARSGGATDPCATFLLVHHESVPVRTPEELVSRAATIVHGRIVGIREGFYYGMPGSLLRIAGTFLRGDPTQELYLFYPMARIATADGMVCARPPKRYGAPQMGDDVIVFAPAPSPAVFGERTILWPQVDQQLVYIPATGAAILPLPLLVLSADDDPVASVLALAHLKSGSADAR